MCWYSDRTRENWYSDRTREIAIHLPSAVCVCARSIANKTASVQPLADLTAQPCMVVDAEPRIWSCGYLLCKLHCHHKGRSCSQHLIQLPVTATLFEIC